jgi:hypothetical protein
VWENVLINWNRENVPHRKNFWTEETENRKKRKKNVGDDVIGGVFGKIKFRQLEKVEVKISSCVKSSYL